MDTDRPPTPQSYIDEQWERIRLSLNPEDRKLAMLAITSAERQAAEAAEQQASPKTGVFVVGGLLGLAGVGVFLLRCKAGMDVSLCEAAQTACELRPKPKQEESLF